MMKLIAPYLLCMLVMWVAVPMLSRAESLERPPPGVFIGTVIGVKSREPVPDVAVIATSANFIGEFSAVTDEQGRYRLPLLPAGTYTLRFEHPDFNTYARADILLRSNHTVRVKVELLELPPPPPPDPVIVKQTRK
ncbi:carboxypeptidase-like regulatory domain-containing protein [Myxococcus qinghaiensis]|uniref:carboxypeptidase-like regulatory domain-containing protein n=1 Tax=Myxococcus qinghaiensis TaxID=2906758 RepID=UPI0020A769EA|nr:carboxypeptidase-like regulatory domain-containing protein [Myxococcus qinghaiensis]MCP3165831.1 carboxypeptidase-like regulatory domain-containing protein [Myxococcus qinghaiensis]